MTTTNDGGVFDSNLRSGLTDGRGYAEDQPVEPAGTLDCRSQYGTDQWGNLVQLAQGFLDGLKDQLSSILKFMTEPWQSLKGLAKLSQQVYDDPWGTLTAIAKAMGQDVQQMVSCGPYDLGLAVGQMASPALIARVVTRLAKYGGKLEDHIECASFAAGTPVWGVQGPTPIESLRTGHTVASRHADTYTDAPQAITRTFGRISPEHYRLTTESETLQITPEHPLWIQGKGWTKVKDIARGDVLATATGDTLVLNNLHIQQPLRVYNFSVATTPSYFVGESGVWVHNAKCEPNAVPDVKFDPLPDGTRFSPNLANHIVNGDGFSRTSGVSGAHNEKQFMSYADQFDLFEPVAHPTIKGIKEVRYGTYRYDAQGNRLNGYKDTFKKTVYNESVISDREILIWAKEAATEAQARFGILKDGTFEGTANNGLKFVGRVRGGEIVQLYPIL